MVATVVGHVGRGVGAVVSAVAVARMGLPALGALVGLAVLAVGVVCWVIASSERTDRVSRLLLAGRGDAKCPPLESDSRA
jgi:hypothetical protein